MFELCWIVSELIVWIFYACVIGLGIVTVYNFVNDDPGKDNTMTRLGKVLLFNFDDDEDLYETE